LKCICVADDGTGSGGDFAETLQRTLGDLARSTQDIQVHSFSLDLCWYYFAFNLSSVMQKWPNLSATKIVRFYRPTRTCSVRNEKIAQLVCSYTPKYADQLT